MANLESGVYAQGLAGIQRVLKRSEHELAPQLKTRLRQGGELVVPVAKANAPFGSRYNFGTPLRDTIKTSVTQRGASMYSTSVYGGVQNYGGRVGRNHATVLKRANVSQYMTKAVDSTHVAVVAHVEGTLDWLKRELAGS